MFKNFWITNKGGKYVSLTFESENVKEENRITSWEIIFPEDCEEEKKRHIIVLNLFQEEDLIRIRNIINAYLENMRW